MKRITTVIISLVVLLAIGAGSWFLFSKTTGTLAPSGTFSEYSAVALTSNELFFGRITNQNKDQVVLEDVYFFTFVSDGTTAATTNAANNQNLKPTLVDTSASDSIAPTRSYVLNRSQIKYSYPLAADSKVVKTIQDYKKK